MTNGNPMFPQYLKMNNLHAVLKLLAYLLYARHHPNTDEMLWK